MKSVVCPQCGAETAFEGNEFRPFCSERCKLLDFGAWADERYALPVEQTEMSEEDVEKLAETLERGEI